MQAYNKAMSNVRVSVEEWMFRNITKYFSFVDFKNQMKINLSATGKMYIVCALLVPVYMVTLCQLTLSFHHLLCKNTFGDNLHVIFKI